MARAVAGAVGTCAVTAIAFTLATGAAGTVASAVDSHAAWSVTVGSADRSLFPGTTAQVPYDVRNSSGGTQRLHGTSVIARSGVDGCDSHWFRIAGNDIANDADVPPGATVHGTLTLAFDAAAASQDACKNISVDVVVTAS